MEKISWRLLTLFCFFSLMLIPQKTQATVNPISETSPLSPDFIQYQINDTISTTNSDGYSMGYIPAPLARVQTETDETIDTSSAFPTSFDLRSTGRLTAVRNQGDFGSCWAFASIASLESYLKASITTDFSENNLMWNNGFDGNPNDGGNSTMAIAYLARWSGPVSESSDPYYSGKNTEMSAIFHVQSAEYLPENAAVIKQALIDGGALDASIYATSIFNSKYYNTSYQCPLLLR